MHTLSGKQFKDMVRGAGLQLKDVADEAGLSTTTASEWYNGHRDILLAGTYDKLITAFEKLQEADDESYQEAQPETRSSDYESHRRTT